MAESVNLSRSRFLHLFKLHTGESPASYRKKLRMAHAKELLETTWMKVRHIGEGVGVNDASHFVRDFKKLHGMSFTEYRIDHRRRQRNKSKSGQ